MLVLANHKAHFKCTWYPWGAVSPLLSSREGPKQGNGHIWRYHERSLIARRFWFFKNYMYFFKKMKKFVSFSLENYIQYVPCQQNLSDNTSSRTKLNLHKRIILHTKHFSTCCYEELQTIRLCQTELYVAVSY